MADFASNVFQKLVGLISTYASAQLYSRYPEFMHHPTTIKVKRIILAVVGFLTVFFSAFFDSLNKIASALIECISAFVDDQFGKDPGVLR